MNMEANGNVKVIHISNEEEETMDVVTVPRDEYNEMVAECTILRVVEAFINANDGPYGDYGVLRTLIGVGCDDEDDEEEEPHE